jgi:LytS/YehU family sensor histidine kinase
LPRLEQIGAVAGRWNNEYDDWNKEDLTLKTRRLLPEEVGMDSLFNSICVLVTAALALMLLPGLRLRERSLLLMRDQGSALLVFIVLGSVEEVSVLRSGLVDGERIVAVCAAGLLAGPLVGGAVGLFVSWLAVGYDGLPLESVGISMLCGGLAGGWLYRWRRKLAQHPLTGFALTFAVSLLRSGHFYWYVASSGAALYPFREIGMAAILQGLGTTLILAIVEQVRDRDEQTRAAASAEVYALLSRINPHFLSNALNTLAALATIAPREIPGAAGRLGHFLRAGFDRPERTLITLEEELAVVRAYLEIESLRLGDRLILEQAIDAGLAEALIPPFSLQPLVENAVHHGLQFSPKAGCVRLAVRRRIGEWLDMSVSDNGEGVPSTEIEQIFFAERQRVHALTLLRRRLGGMFGRSFKLEVHSEIGKGTTVTMRVPLRTPVHVAERADAEGIMAKR